MDENRLADLERRVTQLEAAVGHPTPDIASGTFWALDTLKQELPPGGAVLFTGAATLPSRERYEWQETRRAGDLLDEDWADNATSLAALGHPVRLLLLRAVLHGAHTVADLKTIQTSDEGGNVRADLPPPAPAPRRRLAAPRRPRPLRRPAGARHPPPRHLRRSVAMSRVLARVRVPLLFAALAGVVIGVIVQDLAMTVTTLVLLAVAMAIYLRIGTVRAEPRPVRPPVIGRWGAGQWSRQQGAEPWAARLGSDVRRRPHSRSGRRVGAAAGLESAVPPSSRLRQLRPAGGSTR